MNKKKGIIIGIAVLAVAVAVIGFFAYKKSASDSYTATTMRIVGFEGDVELDDNGNMQTLREDMQMHDGNALVTAKESYVDISLDDTKTAGLDERSSAAFNQSGKKISIELEKGGLYFYTTKKLEDDESMDIKTENMMVGIRGTSGYVRVDENSGETMLYATSGTINVTVTDLNTGETETVEVKPGEWIRTTDDGETIYQTGELSADELPGLLSRKLLENEEVLERVIEESGFKKADIEKSKTNDSYDGAKVSTSTDNDEDRTDRSTVSEQPTDTADDNADTPVTRSTVPVTRTRNTRNTANTNTNTQATVTTPISQIISSTAQAISQSASQTTGSSSGTSTPIDSSSGTNTGTNANTENGSTSQPQKYTVTEIKGDDYGWIGKFVSGNVGTNPSHSNAYIYMYGSNNEESVKRIIDGYNDGGDTTADFYEYIGNQTVKMGIPILYGSLKEYNERDVSNMDCPTEIGANDYYTYDCGFVQIGEETEEVRGTIQIKVFGDGRVSIEVSDEDPIAKYFENPGEAGAGPTDGEKELRYQMEMGSFILKKSDSKYTLEYKTVEP